jgi:lipopolysaccharide export system protein LptA
VSLEIPRCLLASPPVSLRERKRLLLLSSVIVSLTLTAATGKPQKSSAHRPTSEEAPVRIACDDMVVQNRQQTAQCKGHVHATRLLMTLTSEAGLAHYDKDGHIVDLTCTGNVKMVEKDRVATGDKAVYVEESRTVELTGHAVARQGEDVLRGEPLVFYVDEDRVVAKGASLLGKSTDLPQGKRADGGASSPAEAHPSGSR